MVECVRLSFYMLHSDFYLTSHIFGTMPREDEDGNREPTTADIIREKKAARKAERQRAEASTLRERQQRLSFPSSLVPLD